LEGGESSTAACGGLEGGESSTAACGGLEGGESSTAACGGLEGGESSTAACGGLEGGESIIAKAELAIAQPATKATRLIFIMLTPCVFNERCNAGHRGTRAGIGKSDSKSGIPSWCRDNVCLGENPLPAGRFCCSGE
jgi:hypothetical protein